MNKLLENINGWVQNGPMGNDKQWILPAIGAVTSIAGGLMGSSSSNNAPDPISPGELSPYFNQARGVMGQMQRHGREMAGIGRSLMDPNSAMNRQQANMMKQQSADNMALQALLARRAGAASGQNPAITAAQLNQSTGQAGRQSMNAIQQSIMQNRNQGIGVLGQSGGMLNQVLQGQMGIGENLAQAAIAQRTQQQQAAQEEGNMWSNILSGVGSAFMGM